MTLYFSTRDTLFNEEPVILPHDKIMLILWYPKVVSLVSNNINGEMTSLNKIDEFEYFDKVHITSESGIILEHHISTSEGSVSQSFDQNPLKDAILEDGVNKFNNSELCRILMYFEHDEYKVMPNLKLGGQNLFQDTVGPFILANEILLVDRNNENLRVIMHNINCEEAKVSGVLRMYPATIEPHVAARRTGISTLTLSVKGAWNSSSGLLSMTGCLGPTLVECNSGVLLYFPKYFSSKQRSVVSGSIFSLNNATKVFLPVFIGLEMLSPGLHNAIFQYPTLADLKIETFTSLQTYVLIEVLSSGPVFRSNDSRFNEVSNGHVFNISLNLIFIEDPNKVDEESYRHVSKLYLEGVYDQQVGKMYLIACRKVDFDHLQIEYSPLNTRWLINPTAKITITSQQNENDTYNFNSIRLKTFMIPDKNHEQNVIFRNIFEGYFRVFLLLMCIALILNQIKNMKKSIEPVAYISLLTLALWIVGYGITLIYSKEILIKSSENEHYRKQPYDLQNYKRYLNNLDYIARFLVLISMFLMAMISQMVLKARKALEEQSKPTPSEKKLLLVCLVAYLCDFLLGFSIKVVIHLYVDKVNLTKDDYMNIIMKMFLDSVYDLQRFKSGL
ncbi:hypothetical protein R6Q57_009764 [Mikania cordata]